jgi:FtsZ-interacting cell division protein ZipA
MQNRDDLLIFERYQQIDEVFGYGWSPWQKVKAAMGSKHAASKLDVEKQTNQLVASLKRDSGFEDYKRAARDKNWMSGWLSQNLGIDLKNNKEVARALKQSSEPFDVIKTAITQANRLQYAPQTQQPATAPKTQQPVVPQAQAQQTQAQQPQQAPAPQPAQAPQGTASAQALKYVAAIKKMTPGEVAYIKQNLP